MTETRGLAITMKAGTCCDPPPIEGVKYLNLFVKHLGHAGFAVGGLLGEDDHTDAARIPGECQTTISLREVSQTGVGAEPASAAIAS